VNRAIGSFPRSGKRAFFCPEIFVFFPFFYPSANHSHLDANRSHLDANHSHPEANHFHIEAEHSHLDASLSHIDANHSHPEANHSHPEASLSHIDANHIKSSFINYILKIKFMSTPVVPSKDADFDRVSGLVVDDSTQNATQWGIPGTEVTTLTTSHENWHEKYETASNPATRTEGVVAAKNTARDSHETFLRNFLKRWIMSNNAVTDEDHRNMGLPIYKKTRERIPKSNDVPESEGKATDVDGRVSLGWRGRKSDSKANPYGQKVVVKYVVQPLRDPAPTRIDQLVNSLMDSRQPCELSHPEENWGDVLYFATAYQNERGEMGDWSPIGSVIIPGRKI
jgi:hypothetical protein